jgi:hypothetical protein
MTPEPVFCGGSRQRGVGASPQERVARCSRAAGVVDATAGERQAFTHATGEVSVEP